MKTILLTVSEPFIARNVLATDFLLHLRKLRPTDRIVAVMHTGKKAIYSELFSHDSNTTLVEIDAPLPSFAEKILMFLARNTFISGTLRTFHFRSYEVGQTKIPPWFKDILTFLFGRLSFIKFTVRFFDSLLPPSPQITMLFDTYKPDLVVGLVMLDPTMDIPLVREARRRGIHTVGMVRSWDNLTSYGFLRQLPDRFLAQNVFLKEMVHARHLMPLNAISVVGLTHYDWMMDQSMKKSREDFYRELGLDPAKKTVLYAAVGDFLLPSEPHFMDFFELLWEEYPELKDVQFVFRGHPVLPNDIEKKKVYQHIVFDAPKRYGHTDVMVKEEIRQDFGHLQNLLAHSDVVLTPSSSMIIDGPAYDKPTIGIAFDGIPNEKYWFSGARYYDQFDHIKEVVKTGHHPVAYTKEELVSMIRSALSDPKSITQHFAAVRERFLNPLDCGSAIRLAEGVAKEIPA
jgi:hypothetical protein